MISKQSKYKSRRKIQIRDGSMGGPVGAMVPPKSGINKKLAVEKKNSILVPP
jgi:hypothetical protein